MMDSQAFTAAVLRLQGCRYGEIAGLLGVTEGRAEELVYEAVQKACVTEPQYTRCKYCGEPIDRNPIGVYEHRDEEKEESCPNPEPQY